jgi:hypothetical protein
MKEAERISTEKHFMDHCHKCFRKLSWTGVIAGALVATGLSFLFNLFDIGIGLSVVNNTKEGVVTVVVGGLIGMIIGAIVTMFVAGLVSGYIARSCCWHRHLGILQGFTTWCLALVITLVLFSHNIGYLTFGSRLLVDNLSSSPTVRITTDENAPAVSQIRENRPQITVNAEKSANEIGKGALITFLIFFLGAIASCFGGFFGVCRKDGLCHTHERTPNKVL